MIWILKRLKKKLILVDTKQRWWIMCKISISQSPLIQNANAQIKVRDERWRSKLKSDYKELSVSFDNLFRVVQSDYRLYSAGIFKDNFAKNDNWIGQDLLILDIDDGLSIDDAKEFFRDYKAMIHTSASHQKNKGGVKCDRYRVIIPLTESIFCTIKEYTDTMKFVSQKVFPFIDEKCVDPARIYFGHFDCEVYYLNGNNTFDFNSIMNKVKKIEDIEKDRVVTQKPKENIKRTYQEGESIIENFNKNHSVVEILSRNGYKEMHGRWLSPLSSTGLAGVILSTDDNGKEWAYNHHSSDIWENEDAYGIYCILEHNGDHQRACQELKR